MNLHIHLPFQKTLQQCRTFIDSGTASFNNIKVFQGIFLTKRFLYDGSLDQRFILNNSFIDTSTIKVYIGKENTRGIEYSLSENIFDVDKNSRIFFTNEVQDEKYELRFGDGIIGKKLGEDGDGTYITVDYIVTDGRDGNGASNLFFLWNIRICQ